MTFFVWGQLNSLGFSVYPPIIEGMSMDVIIMSLFLFAADKGEFCNFPKDEEALKKLLSPEQYRVIRENGTEQAFQNEYWNNHRKGLYVDAVSGEPLFSSEDKFDSGSGWPSFTKPLDKNLIKEKSDKTAGMLRTEVRSSNADSHLGHVFNDGPGPNHLRYCINSASLKFIPFEELEKKGYGKFLKLFKK